MGEPEDPDVGLALFGLEMMVALAYILVDQVDENPRFMDSVPGEHKNMMRESVERARMTVAFHGRPPATVMDYAMKIVRSRADKFMPGLELPPIKPQRKKPPEH